MRALKATWEGVMCSFRYPHFMVGRQPSYPLPPLSTLYGLLCAAVGRYFDPSGLQVAFTFGHQGRGDDVEHQHLTERLKGRRLPALGGHPGNLEAAVNPVPREVFLRPRLEVYLAGPAVDAFAAALRVPRYPPTLGRSQDLGGFTAVQWVELERASSAHAVGTLALPGTVEGPSQNLLMPRFIPPWDRAQVDFARYDLVIRPQPLRPEVVGSWDVDPTAPLRLDRPRAVIWHRWREPGTPWVEPEDGGAV